ncbi:MAG: GNAT family N-acetyltransferase [Eubacteriales bacterium]|nr:GNAT family N-acetyltransferase [Eubacteriales bacterium]
MKHIWSEKGNLPQDARDIREQVFVQEQGFQAEFDAVDQQSWHVLLYRDSRAIGTARIFFDGRDMHIGRVAVVKDARGDGSGSKLLEICCEKASQLGAGKVVLGAQCRATKFYEKNGFQPFGGIYDDEGCPHQMMEKIL